MLHAINNARVVTAGGVVEGASVVLEGDRIAGISLQAERSGHTLDAGGAYVLPGMVDLHSDAIEKQLVPRPGVRFPLELAFMETDRLFAVSGITTSFDAIPFLEEPGRSVALGRELYDFIVHNRAEGLVRHELHLRCELPQDGSVEAVTELLAEGAAKLVALMDHRPGQGKYTDPAWFRRLYIKTHGEASEEEISAAFEEAKSEESDLQLERVEQVVGGANNSAVVFASHDDDTPDRVEHLAARGIGISEFPVDISSARRAKELGLAVCMGAPNVVRGRSHGGSVSATEAVKLGLVDALCSDYHPPSLLQAAFRLAKENVLSLPAAVKLVSSGPARSVGDPMRGEICEGASADVVVAGERFGVPSVTCTVVAGGVVATNGGNGSVSPGDEPLLKEDP